VLDASNYGFVRGAHHAEASCSAHLPVGGIALPPFAEIREGWGTRKTENSRSLACRVAVALLSIRRRREPVRNGGDRARDDSGEARVTWRIICRPEGRRYTCAMQPRLFSVARTFRWAGPSSHPSLKFAKDGAPGKSPRAKQAHVASAATKSAPSVSSDRALHPRENAVSNRQWEKLEMLSSDWKQRTEVLSNRQFLRICLLRLFTAALPLRRTRRTADPSLDAARVRLGMTTGRRV
jgi:hypothetical protein